jgi:diguanylate cyclase (GGDEF)-like protein
VSARAGQPDTSASWLIRDGMDRERMLDMDSRLRPARVAALGVLAVALVACGPWLGWWTLAPLVLAGVLFKFAEKRTVGMRRPEYAMFAAWAGSEVIIAASIALTGGLRVATISWLGIPIVTLAGRFSNRGIILGVITAMALLLAVAFGVDASAVIHDPTLVIIPAALLIALALLSVALMQSDVEYRGRAVLDQLTGMLNRTALATRVVELTEQSRLTGDAVGLIVADIDHFKRVNDQHGHARGDEVLRDVGYDIRKQLRAYDLAYRLGGEEFLVLLPGADLPQTQAIADQLRRAVEADTHGEGLLVTISCGAAASHPGFPLDYPVLFAAADAALYDAKRSGRNRVAVRDSALTAAA